MLDAAPGSVPLTAEDPPPTVDVPNRAGFRLGFGLVLVLGGVALALYLYGSSPGGGQVAALESYVTQVDAARVSLAQGLDRLFAWLTELMAGGALS